MLIASFSHSVTHAIASHGVYAVFGLMVVAAILPAASELTMLYAGAVAAGAFAGAHVHVFGARLSTGAEAYVAMAIAGLLGNLVGATFGWWLGRRGGRALIERYGTVLHVNPARIDRAERWFDRFGNAAVLLGFATPVVRSFVAIPAGIARMRLLHFVPLAALGCAAFSFGLAGAGWALGHSYTHAHHALRYADYVLGALLVLFATILVWRWIRSSRLARGADPAR
jgi:membrane protein DedA with SNARE-associated domain